MDANDAFVLDGLHLIRTDSDNGYYIYETETGNIKVKCYYTNNIIKYFVVFYPNGTKGIFGYVSNSTNRLFYPLTSLSDQFSNTITFSYTYSDGFYSISNISYNSTLIEFEYTSTRPNPIRAFTGGQEIINQKLLSKITSKQNSNTKGIYILSYTTSISGKSLLSRIDFKTGETYVNPLRFYYNTEPASTTSFTQQGSILSGYNTWTLKPTEVVARRCRFNYQSGSDGLMTVPNLNPYEEHQSDGNNWYTNNYQGTETIYVYDGLDGTSPQLTGSVTSGAGFVDVFSADLRGLLSEDVIKVNNSVSGSNDQVVFSVYRPDLSSNVTQRYSRTFNLSSVYNGGNGHKSIIPKFYFTGDFTGNGKAEVLAVTPHQPFNETSISSKCYIFDLEGNNIYYQNYIFPFHKQFVGNIITDPTVAENNSDKVLVFDCDGDGKTEICYIGATGFSIYTFDLSGSSLTHRQIASGSTLTRAGLANRRILLGDFNGDGLTDILVSPSSTQGGTVWGKHLSRGDGTFAYSTFNGFTYGGNAGEDFIAQDINNDGLSDLIQFYQQSFHVMFSSGDGFNSNTLYQSLPESSMMLIPANITSQDKLTQLIGLWKNKLSKFSYNSPNEYESLILGMANSFGVIEKNTYQLMTDSGGAYSYDASFGNASFPYISFHERIPLLTTTKTIVNRQLEDMNTYTYRNAILHRQGLGFRGFEKVTSTNMRGQLTETTYDQTRFGIPMIVNSPVSENSYSYSVTVSDSKIAKIRLSGAYEGDLLHGTSASTSCIYDSVGNPTAIYKTYSDGTTVNTFCSYNNYDEVGDGYQLGCLYQKIVTTSYCGDSYSERYYVPAFSAQHRPIVEVSSKNGNQVKEVINGYDSHGNVTSESVKLFSSPYRQVTNYTYDYLGRLSSVTSPTGSTTQYAYNLKWEMVTKTDPRGGITHFTYDSFGRETSASHPDGTSGTTTYAWNSQTADGIYAVTNTATGKPTTITHYDALNREVRHSDKRFDGEYRHVDKQYDEYGNLMSESFPFRGTSASQCRGWGYDEFGRLTNDVYLQGVENTYIYNGLSVSKYDNDNHLSSVHTYDVLGNLVSVTDDGGTISYDLGADGQPNSITSPGGIMTSFTYDQYRRRTSITDPSSGTTTYTYDNAGNVATETDANGNTTSYSYDQYNRLVTTTYPEMTVTRTYDTYGDVASVIASNGVTKSFIYDDLGRIDEWEESVDSVWLRKKYYYSNGNISKIAYTTQNGLLAEERFVYSNGHLTTGYDDQLRPLFRLVEENQLGLPTEIKTYYVKRTYSYSNTGIPTGRKAEKNTSLYRFPSLPQVFQDVSYNFDSATGNLLSRTNNLNNQSETFSYDVANRLTVYNGNTVTYDNKGNITAKSNVGTLYYGNSQKPYAVTGLQYTGNNMPTATQDITFNSYHRLDSISEGIYSSAFTYDGDLDRVKQVLKKNGNNWRVRYYLGNCYEYTIDSEDPGEVLYAFGGYYDAPVAIKKSNGNTSIYHLVRDHQGSVTNVVEPLATYSYDFSYDAWGNFNYPTQQAAQDPEYLFYYGPKFRGYCGHEFLIPFGLINMNARLYDPITSRFLAPDPYVQMPDNSQSFNRYSYCLNNPLKYVDEDGENPLATFLIGIGVGAVIGAGTSALSYSISSAGDWHNQDFWRAVGIGAISGAIGGAFGAAGSLLGAGSIGNSIGYNFMSGTVNTVVTRSMFGQRIQWTDILPTISASLIGSCFPTFKGVNGGWFVNSMAEIGFNTLKGGTMGFAAGVTDAAIHHDISRIWQNVIGGAVSGAVRTTAMNIVFGAPIHIEKSPDQGGLFRSGGLSRLLTGYGSGLTIGRNIIMNPDIEETAYHEDYHIYQQNKWGWANFYGRIIWEYIKYLPSSGLNGLRHPSGSLEYDAYHLLDTAYPMF